jgi:hypothetical protein
MKPHLAMIAALLGVSASLAAGDHFPIAQGKTWLFNYIDKRGGWGSVITDSGTVSWRMQQVTTDGIAPGKVTTTVSICRTFGQIRKSFRPGRTSEAAYDSIFSPPRTSVDTVYVASSNQETGVLFKGDTCWSFVHDPKATLPGGKLSIRDTVVQYNGQATAASIIDQSPCRSEYSDQSFYITAKDIGPVEYRNTSSEHLMDAFWATEWKLVEVGASIMPRGKPVAAAGSPCMIREGKRLFFEGPVGRTGKLVASFYNVNGALRGTVKTGISSAGFQRIEIPVDFHRGTAFASGPCILKLATPDGAEITGLIPR